MNENLAASRDAIILATLERAKRQAGLPPNQLQTELFPDLLKQVRHAFESTKYWKRVLSPRSSRIVAARNFSDLIGALPLLTRSELQRNLQDMRWFPGGVSRSQLVETTTSGSTGQPVRVLQYRPDVEPFKYAFTLLDSVWQQRDFSRPIAFFRSSGQQGPSSGPAEPYRLLGNQLPGITFSPKGKTFAELLDFLVDEGIGIVLMNMVMARGIAREQLINPRENLQLREVLGWTETVTAEDRLLVREALQSKISNRYSSEEFAHLAIQCPKYDHLHALQMFNYIEILDDAGNPCPQGVSGNVVVTSLRNRAQPMFRYLLGDTAAWDEPCDSEVNLPVLLPRLTRQRDTIKLADGRDWLPALGSTPLVKQPIVFDFQVVLFQNALVALYTPTPNWGVDTDQQVREGLAVQFPLDIPVLLIKSPSLLWLGTWKRRTFIKISESVPLDIDEAAVRDAVLASGYKPDAGVGVISETSGAEL